jgi:hypothetical protein
MLGNYEDRAIIVIAVFMLLLFLGVKMGWWDLTSVLSWVPYFLLAGMIGTFLLGFRERIEKLFGKETTTTEPSAIEAWKKVLVKSSDISTFSHLTIHYSQKTENPDTLIDSAQPKYVTNNTTHAAFLVPAWLKPYIQLRKISIQPHDGERALRRFIGLFDGKTDHEPTPRELGLRFEGKILVLAQESDLLSKLKGHKLEDLRVVSLHRLRARRTLLLKKSTKEAFEAPLCVSELIANDIIADWEILGMRPWENCRCWSKRQGYTFHPWRYSESELTKGL